MSVLKFMDIRSQEVFLVKIIIQTNGYLKRGWSFTLVSVPDPTPKKGGKGLAHFERFLGFASSACHVKVIYSHGNAFRKSDRRAAVSMEHTCTLAKY